MLLGFYAARALHLDSAEYKGLEIFLGKYVMPAVNFYMLARSDMYAVYGWQLY
jgi:predicted permease